MSRVYPNNADGDALQRIADHGSNMSKPMRVDFCVAVPNESAGKSVAELAATKGFVTELVKNHDGLGWTCYCTKVMVPTYDAIIAAQDELNEISKPYGGYGVGWETPGNVDELTHVPRWIEIPIGIFISLFTLMCLAGSITLLVVLPQKNKVISVLIGIILVLLCAWVLEKGVRLITGLPKKGGLLSPFALRIASVLFFCLPIGGIFTGYYSKRGPIAFFQAIMCLLTSVSLLGLARSRDSKLKSRV